MTGSMLATAAAIANPSACNRRACRGNRSTFGG